MFLCNPEKQKLSVDDMIKDVEKGIYIIGDGSFSIDQQRYNFQFGGQIVLRDQKRKDCRYAERCCLSGQYAGVLEFLRGHCDESDYRLGGSFFDGKGQPGQSSAVSHGCSTTRFNGVNVINTARKI